MENINYEYPLHVLFEEVAAWGREKNINDEVMQYAKINDAIGDILVTVIIFADIIGVDPRGALEEAYNTIKDRKGHTEHGSFIKDDQTGEGE